jgi:formylglycine-generating enzyme required for sulfatase activity
MERTIFLTIILVTILPVCVLANSAPVVSNVTATQRADDSKLVDIHYDVADADGDNCTVWAVASDNNGISWQAPVITTTGAIGGGVAPGVGKHIIWDAGRDMPGKVGNYKVRVIADDGKGPAPMIFVPAGNFLYKLDWYCNWSGGHEEHWIYVNSFMIDKYEVTNTFYCEFLNSADPCGNYYSSHMTEIARGGSYGNYYYTVNPGKENYPVRWVSRYGAEAFAQWRSSIYGGTYRLPTQEEWEKAAGWDPVLQKLWRYGFQRDIADCNWCNYHITDVGDCYGGSLPVGSFNGTGGKNDAKSYYGCYDMTGNVSEMVTAGDYPNLRGGSWRTYDYRCEVSWQGCCDISYCSSDSDDVGFRLVLVAE